MECHDFMENFTFGLCMGNFALSVLCKVLMDMKYFEPDFISETKHLGWGNVVKDLMKSDLDLGFFLDRLPTSVNNREESLGLSSISSNLSQFPTPEA